MCKIERSGSDRPARRNRRVGFTLVELLVVIGIIAVLISILLPTLSRARESAKRTQCLSNLRQIAVFLNMYANQYKGVVPLGANSGGDAGRNVSEGNNYNISRPANSTTVGGFTYGTDAESPGFRYVGLGLLVKANYVKEDAAGGNARIFFCPTLDGDIYHGFNAVENHWPPSKNEIRASYSSRCSTNNSNPIAGSQATDMVTWGYGASPGPFWALKVSPGATVLDGVSKADMFRLSKLKSRAIVADVVSSITRVKPGHLKGINVLYANGGAHWVDQGMFMKQLNIGGGNMFNTPQNYLHDQIWNNFDFDKQLY